MMTISADLKTTFFLKPYRIFNTWMGEPNKLAMLESVMETIEKDKLLEVVKQSGDKLLTGLTDLQVLCDFLKYYNGSFYFFFFALFNRTNIQNCCTALEAKEHSYQSMLLMEK